MDIGFGVSAAAMAMGLLSLICGTLVYRNKPPQGSILTIIAQVCYGATYFNIDVLENMKDKSKTLLVEDNGGGMAPDEMRQCMSLGYSAKSMMANTIGQYGNGFQTSTMRLGADVIVFSRCQGNTGGSATQSIGMLSYTFLQKTGKEDIVVPMIDYEKRGETWNKLVKWLCLRIGIIRIGNRSSNCHNLDMLQDVTQRTLFLLSKQL